MTSNGHISKAEFLAATPIQRDVELPNGQKLPMQSVTLADRVAFAEWLRGGERSEAEICARAVRICSPLFEESDEDSLMALPYEWIAEAGALALELMGSRPQKKSIEQSPADDGDAVKGDGD